MTKFLEILLIYLVALISVTILPKLSIFSVMPNLILILALLFVFQREFNRGLLWALLGGLFLDFFGINFPSNILITIVIVLLTMFLIQRFFESSNIYLFLIFCFLGSFIYNFSFLITYHLLPITYDFFTALYSTLFGFISYLVYLQLQKRAGRKLGLIHWEHKDEKS